MYKCEECNKEFKNIKAMSLHNSKMHDIKSQETYNKLVLAGEPHKCECGCGNITKFLSPDKGYQKYIRGHASKINNNWGHNTDALNKSHKTQKEMYKNGELVIWNKGLTIEDPRVKDYINKIMSNPKRGANISKALSGVPKSEEHKNNLRISQIKSWLNLEKREKQSLQTIKRLIKNNHRNKKTKLEINFETLLVDLNINFEYQYVVELGIFDFYLNNFNILIEVDGDFHHCNPKTKHWPAKFPIQINTINNDIRKNNIAKNNNIKILRFWEKDINENIEWVKEQLIKELYKTQTI